MSASTKSKLAYAIVRWRSLVENVIQPSTITSVSEEVKQRFCREILNYPWQNIEVLHSFLSVPTYKPILMEIIRKRKTVQDVIDMPDRIKDDMSFMKQAMEYNSKILGVASSKIRSDRAIAEWASTANPPVLHKMLIHFASKELLLPIFERDSTYIVYYLDRPDVLSDKEIMLAAVKASSMNIVHAKDKLKEDPDLILSALDNLLENETLRGRVSRMSISGTSHPNMGIIKRGLQKDLVWLLSSTSTKLNSAFCVHLSNAMSDVTSSVFE